MCRVAKSDEGAMADPCLSAWPSSLGSAGPWSFGLLTNQCLEILRGYNLDTWVRYEIMNIECDAFAFDEFQFLIAKPFSLVICRWR